MYRYSIIACARWEAPYIAEWIAYYEKIGFDHIYLYCNDDDPTELHRALPPTVPGFVSFTHFPGQGRQSDMYIAAMEEAANESEWVAFLDIDEFMVLRDCNNIHQFMEPFCNEVDSVHFNWIYFGNNGFAERPPGSVLQQYIRRSASVTATTKHLSRGALLDRKRLEQPSHPPFWHGLSDPVWSGFRRVNVLGEDVAPLLVDYPAWMSSYLANERKNADVFNKAVINHYAMKSEADFLFRARRGTKGDFSGQILWRNHYESGEFRNVLATMNQAEDTYLRDFSLRVSATVAPPETAPRSVPIRIISDAALAAPIHPNPIQNMEDVIPSDLWKLMPGERLPDMVIPDLARLSTIGQFSLRAVPLPSTNLEPAAGTSDGLAYRDPKFSDYVPEEHRPTGDLVNIPYSATWNIGRIDFLAKLGTKHIVGEKLYIEEVGVAFERSRDSVFIYCDATGTSDNIKFSISIHATSGPYQSGKHPSIIWSSAQIAHGIPKGGIKDRFRGVIPDASISGILFHIRSCLLEIRLEELEVSD